MLKTAKFFYFCHLKKWVRPETFGPPYYVCAEGRTEGLGAMRPCAFYSCGPLDVPSSWQTFW